ncbi:hypothetical protein HWV62_43198 [Athelia sp. TMB]|nr:hypothetical protein HWV62_43198 [Athelia sp. TMB]
MDYSSGFATYDAGDSMAAGMNGACDLRIGEPIHFSTGQFAGRTVRAELIEVQQAQLGRKEVENIGFVCHVDLFPATPPLSTQGDGSVSSGQDQYLTYTPEDFAGQNPRKIVLEDRRQPREVSLESSQSTPPSFSETSKCTDSLMGETFVQPICMDIEGKKALIAVFGDLAVRITGVFVLRYRIFDVFSKSDPGDSKVPINAECFGGPFRIYASKDFPGLLESTELTKALARWGVRVNVRATERKRRRRSLITATSSKGKGKAARRGTTGSGDDDDDDS